MCYTFYPVIWNAIFTFRNRKLNQRRQEKEELPAVLCLTCCNLAGCNSHINRDYKGQTTASRNPRGRLKASLNQAILKSWITDSISGNRRRSKFWTPPPSQSPLPLAFIGTLLLLFEGSHFVLPVSCLGYRHRIWNSSFQKTQTGAGDFEVLALMSWDLMSMLDTAAA